MNMFFLGIKIRFYRKQRSIICPDHSNGKINWLIARQKYRLKEKNCLKKS